MRLNVNRVDVCVGVVWKHCIHVVRPGIVCCNQKILFVVGSALLLLPFKAQLLLYHQFNIHEFCVLPTQCVLCGSQNRPRLFPYAALTDGFL